MLIFLGEGSWETS